MLDGHDPDTIATAARQPCAAVRCWACPPKPSTVWPPMPATTLPWRNFAIRAAPATTTDRACGRRRRHCPLCQRRARVCAKLVEAFWPGPLALILPRLTWPPQAPRAGRTVIGLRCPAHPVAHALLVACARQRRCRHFRCPPWRAPSANRFGRVGPTTAQHVQDRLGDDPLVLDGGPCQVGIESTIVDCTWACPCCCAPAPSRASRSSRLAAWRRCPKKTCPITPPRLWHAGGAPAPGCQGAADGCQGPANRAGPAGR